VNIIRVYHLPYVLQRKNSDRQVFRQLIRGQITPIYSDLSVILVYIPITSLYVIREMQDPLNFIINPRFGPVAKHTYHWVIELLYKLIETEFCGIMLEQGGLCSYFLGSAISIHLLHGKSNFFYLEENEQVCQY
jgi:hypothetical protein